MREEGDVRPVTVERRRGKGASALTVKERILLHLLEYARYDDEYEVPAAISRSGIAAAVGIEARHVPQYTRPLLEEGALTQRLAHIVGGGQRQKVYLLTDGGKMTAARMRASVRERLVTFRSPEGTRECSVAAVESALAGKASLLLILEAAEQGVVDAASLGRAKVAEDRLLEGVPAMDGFVGREWELQVLPHSIVKGRVVSVVGMAGMGKTALAARLATAWAQGPHVLWHRVQSWDTARSVLFQLGNFLAALGHGTLRSYLASGPGLEIPKTCEIIAKDLGAETPVLLVMDDLHHGPPEVRELLGAVVTSPAAPTGLMILTLSRTRPDFYDRRDVVLEDRVIEHELGGLDEPSALYLLGRTAPKWAGVVRNLGGHPLLLRLLARRLDASLPDVSVLQDVNRFLGEVVVAHLSDSERRMMHQIALYRLPVEADAIFTDPALNYDVLRSLIDRTLIREAEGRYAVHDAVREFFAGLAQAPQEARRLREHAVHTLLEAAHEAETSRRMTEAVALYANLVEIAEDGPDRNRGYEALGDHYARLGEFQKAMESRRFWERGAKDPKERARALRKLAEVLLKAGQTREALENLASAEGVLPREAVTEQGWIALTRSKAFWLEGEDRLGDYLREAELAYERFVSGSEESGLGQSAASVGLGLVRRAAEGDYQAAEGWFMRAIDHSDRARDERGKAEVFKNLAILYSYLKRPEEALRHATLCREIAEASQDIYLLRKCLFTEGWARYELLGDYTGAEECFRRALGIAKRAADLEGVVYFHAHMARIARALRRHRDAVESVDTYLSLSAGSLERGQLELEMRSIKAECAAQAGDLPLAESELGKCHDLRTQMKDSVDPLLEFYFERAGGVVSWKTGRGEEARVRFLRAVELAGKSGDVPAMAEGHALLGWLALEQGDRDQARSELLRAAEVYEREGRKEEATRVRASLATLDPS